MEVILSGLRRSVGRTPLAKPAKLLARWLVPKLFAPKLPFKRLPATIARAGSGDRPTVVSGASRIAYSNGVPRFNLGSNVETFLDLLPHYHCQEEFIAGLRCDGRSILRDHLSFVSDELSGAWQSICHPGFGNYMHWMSECLPAAVAGAATGSGLIHDRDIPQSALEVLATIMPGRDRIALPAFKRIRVERLVSVPMGWSVGWARGNFAGIGEHSFIAEHLVAAREASLKALNIHPKRRTRMFVRRRSSLRDISEHRIEAALASKFEIVSPGGMSFAAQVEAFARADTVVAQAGAALANMMFMPRGSRVICLAADTPYVDERYFRTYGSIFGVDVSYIRGAVPDLDRYSPTAVCSAAHPVNASFVICNEQISDLLTQLT